MEDTRNTNTEIPANYHITELGPLPKEWEVVRLGDIFDIQQGKQLSQKNRVGNNQKYFLRTANVLWGFIDTSKLDKMNFTYEEEIKYRLEFGDLLVCEGGDIGRTAVWENNIFGCYYQNHLHRLRAKQKDIVNSYFYLYWFWYAFEFADLYFGHGNITTIPNLSSSRLSMLKIPLPPLSEQKRIAGVLSTVQKAIEKTEELIQSTKELKKSLMNHLFRYGLCKLNEIKNSKLKDREIGLIPKHWEVVRLGEVAEIKSGGTPSRKIKNYYNGNNLWVKSGELEDNVILDTEEKITDEAIKNSSAKIFPKGTVLIAMYGATVGKTGILGKEATTNQAVCAILPNYEIFIPEFIRHYFIVIRDELLKQRYGGAQPNISQIIIKNTLVPKPNISEQKAIAEILSTVDQKIEYLSTKKQKLQELFRTLLHELMTASVRVNGKEWEWLEKEKEI